MSAENHPHMHLSYDDIVRLHKKYAPSEQVFDLIFTHCLIVRDIANQLADNSSVKLDRELVETGALLHDIGAYPLFEASGAVRDNAHYITHGIEGERILKDEGFPEAIWRIASHHTGSGLSIQDITEQNLPLPVQDYMAETDEERLIMYADKFHSKSTPPYFNSIGWFRDYLTRFGPEVVTRFEELATIYGEPDLEPLNHTYGFAIR